MDPSTDEVAFSFSQVLGRQTVPRAEMWALMHVLRRMQTGSTYSVYIDASYVINGLRSRSAHYCNGSNGDLWTMIFAELARLEATAESCINFIKVKSHVEDDRTWTTYNMTPEGLILNELADAAVARGTASFARSFDAIRNDQNNLNLATKVAKRIATIEAHVWRLNDSKTKFHGKDFDIFRSGTGRTNKEKVQSSRRVHTG